jgi:hypothetical protein
MYPSKNKKNILLLMHLLLSLILYNILFSSFIKRRRIKGSWLDLPKGDLTIVGSLTKTAGQVRREIEPWFDPLDPTMVFLRKTIISLHPFSSFFFEKGRKRQGRDTRSDIMVRSP